MSRSCVFSRRPEGESGLALVSGSPRALELALLERIASIRASDSLCPVDVVVGGVLLRPYLQRRLADTSAGLVNVRLSTLGELGLRLGEPSLAASGRRPLPAVAERAYVREVADASSGYFEPVASTPGFAEAVRRLVRELRQEGIDPDLLRELAPAEAESAGKGRALADLYDRYLVGRADAYDGEDALAAADARSFDGDALFVYGIWRLSAVARDVIERIAERVPVVFLLPAIAADTDDVHVELRAWLTACGANVETLGTVARASTLGALQHELSDPTKPAANDGTVELVSAPDPLAEVREVARACLVWAEQGIAFREMAVSYRQAEVYRPLVEAVFSEAGIPVYLDDGPSLAERPLGRRVLAVLDLIDSPFRRRDVIGLLSDGRMPRETRERFGDAPAARWDSVSRRAGIVEGVEQWRGRLGRLRQREAEAASGEEAPDWLQGRVDDCDSLLAFVDVLARDLERRPERGSWVESLSYIQDLLATYVEGVEAVSGYLDQLAELDRLVGEVEFARFLDVVRAEVKALKAGDLDEGQQGAFGRRGVNVLDLSQLRHLRFRAVAVLGLAERVFPPPPQQDPLLLDDERERLNDAGDFGLPLRARGADPEPMQFALAVHAAGERLMLSTRRAEEAGGRAQLPSMFFRAAASALEGRRVRVEEIAGLGCVRRVPAGRVGASSPEAALTLEERDRTVLELEPVLGRALLERLEPRAARADALRRARWSTRSFTTYDAVFTDADALELLASRLDERLLYPTHLETYATCPYQYLLAHVLRVRPLEEPESVLRIDPRTKGTVAHRILRRLVAELGSSPVSTETAAHRARLEAILEEELSDAEAQGLTGAPLLWAADRRELVDDLLAWFDQEVGDGAVFTESAVEVKFGETWADGPRSPLASDDPLVLEVGERELRIGGVIDRIDHAADGAYRIIDYKSGAGVGLPRGGQLSGGRALQLPIYLLAGAMLLEADHRDGEAGYHVVSRRGRLKRITFTGADYEARRDDIQSVLTRIADGLAGGDFHPEPSDSSCHWCDYQNLCDVGRSRIRQRKAADPRASSFDEMQGIA